MLKEPSGLPMDAFRRTRKNTAEAETSLRRSTGVATAFTAWSPTKKRVDAHACVYMRPIRLRQSPPPTLILLPPPAPPTWCRGVMPHPLGACCSRAVCSSSLFASLCLLPAWRTERVWASFVVIPKPPALIFYPPPQLTANCSSQHQDPTPPTRPRPASWLCGILATANGGPIESLRRAARWLDSRIISNEDDSNDFTPSFPSPLLLPEYWYF